MIRFLVKCRLFRTDSICNIIHFAMQEEVHVYSWWCFKSIQTISIYSYLFDSLICTRRSVGLYPISQIMTPLFNNYLEQWLLLRNIWTLLIYRSSRSNLFSSFKVLLVGILIVSLLGNYKLLKERSVTKIFGKSWRML